MSQALVTELSSEDVAKFEELAKEIQAIYQRNAKKPKAS
jgi:hypothetical protein